MKLKIIGLVSLFCIASCNESSTFVSQDQGAPTTDESSADATSADSNPASTKKETKKIDPNVPTEKVVSISQQFDSAATTPGSVTLNLAESFLEQGLEMLRNYSDKAGSMQQSSRPVIRDNFTQGYPASTHSESFLQRDNRAVDLLVVIDNSRSMIEEQTNLAQKLDPLLSYITDTDWQIGVVTTDPADGCLRSLIKKGDTNINTKFSNAIKAGINGSGYEQGVYQATSSLRGSCLAAPWIRQRSTVAVLIVSDEDNCSNGSECGNVPHASGDYLYNYLASIRDIGKNAFVHGIFHHPQEACSTALNPAPIYANLVARTSGTWGSICSTDYTQTLRRVSENIAASLSKSFTIASVPNAGSAKVFVNSVELASSSYTISNKLVELNTAPADQAVIRIDYATGGEAMQDSFRLANEPFTDYGFSISLNGVTVPASDYTYDPTTQRIRFNQEPAARAQIAVSYKRNSVLPKDFIIGTNAKTDSIEVTVNGVLTSAYSYISTLGLVRFDTPPPEDATIAYKYRAIGDPVLRYAFAVADQEDTGLSVLDANTGATVPASYSAGYLNFTSSNWSEGRLLKIRYLNPQRDDFSVELPQEPYQGRVALRAGGISCSSESEVKVTGRLVEYKNCDLPTTASTAEVSFDYVTGINNIFVLQDVDLPSEEIAQTWRVLINDVETNEYVRVGSTITLNAMPPVNSQIRVELTYKKTIAGS